MAWSAVSPGHCTCSHIISSTGCHPKCWIRTTVLHHLSYLPEVAPIDFYFFSKLKEFMKGCKFTDDEDVICAKNGRLEEQDQQFFYNGIRALEKHGTKCI